MPLGDLELIGRRIPREPDHFHTVQEGLRDRVQRVGRADEQHVGQIVGNIHIVVCESAVLLGIEHLQQCAGRISVVGDGQLVDFIQDHDRIGDAALLDAVHDPARHSADVGPAVSADIRFIPHAAETYAHIFSVKRFCDALSDAGLAGTRCADKQQDRTRLLLFEIHDCDLLDNTLFDLAESEVILLKDSFRLGQVNVLHLFLLPGQTCDKIQIVVKHSRFRSAVALLFETVEHLERLSLRGLVHARLFDLELKLADVRHLLGVHLVEFALQKLHLFFDGGFLVDLLVILLLRAGGLRGHLGDLHELVDGLFQQLQPLLAAVLCQNTELLLRAHLEPDRHSHRDLADGVELLEIAHGLLAPLKALPVLFEVLLELLKVAFGNIFIQVLIIGSSGNSQLDRMVGVDADHIQVDTSHRTDHHISFRIHFIDKTGHTDRIKALFCHVLPVLFFFARKEHDPVVDLRVSARQMPVLVLLEVYIGVGHDQ